MACPPDGIVLDSFAGSGTTAHAVLKANARDNGNRRFILIEGEDYAEALAETVEPSVRLPLLKLLATEKAYESKHAHYVQLLYSKLSALHTIILW
mgnify:FL=1